MRRFCSSNSFGGATLISSDLGQTMTLKEGFYVAWNTKQRRVGRMQIRPELSVLYVFLTYEEFSVITFHYAMLCN